MSNAPATGVAPNPIDILAANKKYLRLSTQKLNRMIQASGSAITQNYVAGAPLVFNVPTVPDGYLEGIWVYCALVVTPATGAAAAYQLNAGAPLNVFDSIQVRYNGVHQDIRPHHLRTFALMQGFQALPIPSQVIAGQAVSFVNAYMNSGGTSMPITVNAGNAWNFGFYLPLNWSNPYDARGMLPIEFGETTAQVVLNTALAFMGVDPILSPMSTTGGTGAAVTATGTVYCVGVYRDGDSLIGPGKLPLMIEGIGTAQVMRDNNLSLTGIGTTTMARQRLGIQGHHRLVLATIVDGNQSNKFCADSNINVIDLCRDANGNSPFWRYGSLTNIPVQLFFAQLRQLPGGDAPLGQDIDEGIIPIVSGLNYGETEAGGNQGQLYLDNTPGSGWSDTTFGLQLGTTGGIAGITPRVEFQTWFLTDRSLQRVG